MLIETEATLSFRGAATRAHAYLLEVSIQVCLNILDRIRIGVVERQAQVVYHSGMALLNKAQRDVCDRRRERLTRKTDNPPRRFSRAQVQHDSLANTHLFF